MLPTTFADAGDEAAARMFPETNAAYIEPSHISTTPAAEAATIIHLGRPVRFFSGRQGFHEPVLEFLFADFERFSGHRGDLSFLKGETEGFEEFIGFCVIAGRGLNGQLDPVNFTHIFRLNFRKNRVFANANRIIPMTIE